MGFFTDVVVVPEKDVKRVAREVKPSDKWPGCEASNLDEVTFGSLWSILVNDDDADAGFEDVPTTGRRMLVCRFPDEYVDRLSRLDEKGIARSARKWSKTEELDGLYEAEDLEDVLRNVSRLAREARTSGNWLLLCTSGA
jgi:hypothetical protein